MPALGWDPLKSSNKGIELEIIDTQKNKNKWCILRKLSKNLKDIPY